jgi:hypothetical protein
MITIPIIQLEKLRKEIRILRQGMQKKSFKVSFAGLESCEEYANFESALDVLRATYQAFEYNTSTSDPQPSMM